MTIYRNKYHNKKTIVDGITFHSQKEAVHYQKLKALECAGKITDLTLQPSYVLQESFKYNNETIRSIVYKADFSYIDLDTNAQIVVDIKGMLTRDYIIKKKLFLKKYGDGIQFYEI